MCFACLKSLMFVYCNVPVHLFCCEKCYCSKIAVMYRITYIAEEQEGSQVSSALVYCPNH